MLIELFNRKTGSLASGRGTKSSSCLSFPIHLLICMKINLNSLYRPDTVMIWDENQTRPMAVRRIRALLIAPQRYPEKASTPNSAGAGFVTEGTAKEKKYFVERTEGVYHFETNNDEDRSQR